MKVELLVIFYGVVTMIVLLLMTMLISNIHDSTVDRLDEIEACVCQCADEPEVPR